MEIKNVFRLAGTSVMKILELQIKKILKDYKGKKKEFEYRLIKLQGNCYQYITNLINKYAC